MIGTKYGNVVEHSLSMLVPISYWVYCVLWYYLYMKCLPKLTHSTQKFNMKMKQMFVHNWDWGRMTVVSAIQGIWFSYESGALICCYAIDGWCCDVHGWCTCNDGIGSGNWHWKWEHMRTHSTRGIHGWWRGSGSFGANGWSVVIWISNGQVESKLSPFNLHGHKLYSCFLKTKTRLSMVQVPPHRHIVLW